MTRRIDKPDTPADNRLRDILSGPTPRSFVMVAGAGSGKTTSLVKALDFIRSKDGATLRHKQQRIACITYTAVATNEIWGDVGNDSLFHVSTIHSFLWEVIKPFQRDIGAWVEVRIDRKLAELSDAAEKFTNRTQQRTRDKNASDVERYRDQKIAVRTVSTFRYMTGSDYPNGILGHADVLSIGPELLAGKPLLQRVFASRYPYVFVDESQDTDPAVVEALKSVARAYPEMFAVGFFGDPMQKIYMVGLGEIPIEPGWSRIEKPENFRCPTSVLKAINNVRAGDDGLSQIRGRTVTVDGIEQPFHGKARLLVVPADDERRRRLEDIRNRLAEEDDDSGWLHSDTENGGTKVLVIAHRMAARHLGFGDMHDAFNSSASENLRESFRDGTHWSVRPFLTSVLPAIDAHNEGNATVVMRLLRAASPRLDREYVQHHKVACILSGLSRGLTELGPMLAAGSGTSVRDVVRHIHSNGLFSLDERLTGLLENGEQGVEAAGSDGTNLIAFLDCRAEQLLGYRRYIEKQSPFDTQQGIKGAEFPKVIVVLDDEEGRHNQFSYEKYLGLKELSETDRKHISQGEESTLDRTRRLFYVCCSRATESLAVVLFAHDVTTACEELKRSSVFSPSELHALG